MYRLSSLDAVKRYDFFENYILCISEPNAFFVLLNKLSLSKRRVVHNAWYYKYSVTILYLIVDRLFEIYELKTLSLEADYLLYTG